MNTTHNTKTKRLIAALGVAAAAAATPALLFAGTGTAHAGPGWIDADGNGVSDAEDERQRSLFPSDTLAPGYNDYCLWRRTCS